MRIISFSDVLKQCDHKKHLLLGNGFSIALKPDIFTYTSLYENADFTKVPFAKEIFNALETRDFEAVIRVLINISKILKVYNVSNEIISKIEADAAQIKTILVSTIAGRHPNRPNEISDDQYRSCRKFLSHFDKIYTLNYDVLLYWALMHDEVDEILLKPDDGFRSPEDDHDAEFVSWQQHHAPTVYYLHGALHLFDAGKEIIKYTWSRTDVPLLEQIRIALDHEKYPMFVSEGDSDSKKEKILHNAYLHKAMRSFSSITGSIVIFGHSLDENDSHVLHEIVCNTKIDSIFISLIGDLKTKQNQDLILRGNALYDERKKRHPKKPLVVKFFDATSASVWG